MDLLQWLFWQLVHVIHSEELACPSPLPVSSTLIKKPVAKVSGEAPKEKIISTGHILRRV